MVKIKNNQAGFSLMEVMIALTIFATFVTAFIVGQGSTLRDSAFLQEEALLAQLAEKVITDIKVKPPKLESSLTLAPETKSFEQEDYEGYTYTVEWKEVEIPDLSKLMGEEEDESNEASSEADRNKSVEAMIFKQIKDNLKKMIWQVKVTITNKETKYNHSLSMFITDPEAKVELKWQ